jgi:periplasmic protein TonB
MILRALLISLVLHLAILVSAEPELSGRKESGQERRQRIAATLRGQALVREAVSVATKTEGRSNRPVPGGQRPADYSKIASFLGPTVALANHGRTTDRQADDDDAPEVFLPAGDSEREYRLNLAREARRYRRHPSGVSGRNAEGVVVVSVFMQIVARQPETRLLQSSGDEALDRAALEMMEQAVKTAGIPLELQGKRFRIAVPVEYRLAD